MLSLPLLFGFELFLEEVLESVEQTLVSIGNRKVGDSRSVLDQFKQVLVVFNGLLGYPVIHGSHGEAIDLLDDGVALLAILSLVSLDSISVVLRSIIIVHFLVVLSLSL